MVSKPKAPTPPDPAQTAQAQTSSNIDTAIANGYLNATNQNTPYGTVKYNQTGTQMVGNNAVPTFESTTSLNPQYQAIQDSTAKIGQQSLDTGGQLLNNVQSTISSPFSLNGLPATQTSANGGPIQGGINTSGLPQMQTSLNTSGLPNLNKDYSADGQRVSDALMSRFNTDWTKQSAANDVKMANQGIAAGSEAYGANQDSLNRARNDAQSQAILAGGQEQSRLFGLDLASRQQGVNEGTTNANLNNSAQSQLFGQAADQASFGNQAQAQRYSQDYQNANLNNQGRQQGITEQQTVRNQPLNELATLLGFTPGIQTPNAPSFSGNVAGTDVAGITQNGFANQMAGYQQKMTQQNAAMNGLFGLGQAAMFASDRRLKTNIRRLGKTALGIPIYSYNYKVGGPLQIGVMADEVEKIIPFAVHEINGFKTVDYSVVQ